MIYEPAGTGGMGQYGDAIAEALQSLAHVSVLTTSDSPYYKACQQENVHRQLVSLKNINHGSRLTRSLELVWHYFRNMLRLWGRARRWSADVVHIQACLYLTDWVVMFIMRLSGLSLVFTVHDVYPHHWLLPSFLRWLERLCLRLTYACPHSLVVHTDRGRRQLIDELGVPASKIWVIPHGAHPRTRPPKTGRNDHSLRILCFGNLHPYKGLETALQALVKMMTPATLTISGRPVNGEYTQKCRELAERLRVSTLVQWDLRFVPDGDIPELFGQADLCLMSYTHFDSQSGVLLQSLSYGVPVVVSDLGGLGEVVKEYGVGVAFPANDSERLAAVLDDLFNNRSELERMGNQGYDLTQNEFSWATVATQHRALYSSNAKGVHS